MRVRFSKQASGLELDINKTSDEYGAVIAQLFLLDKISFSSIKDVIISSVVPEVMHSLENFCDKVYRKDSYGNRPGNKNRNKH